MVIGSMGSCLGDPLDLEPPLDDEQQSSRGPDAALLLHAKQHYRRRLASLILHP